MIYSTGGFLLLNMHCRNLLESEVETRGNPRALISHPQLHPEVNNDNLRRKMRFAPPPQAGCLIAKEIVSQQETINCHCII